MAKKKITKKKKVEIQDYISKIKDLRKIHEPVSLVGNSDAGEANSPADIEWRGQPYHIEKVIARWKILETNDMPNPKDCFRVELSNGFQIDLSNELKETKWNMIGIEQEFYDKARTS